MSYVDLSCGAAGLGLLLPCPSGVVYSNQTGGTHCLHPTIEGVYVPIKNQTEEGVGQERRSPELTSPEHELVEYFVLGKYEGAGATDGLDEDDAAFIEAVLEKWDVDWLEVDRRRLGDSHEAWVHVIVLHEQKYGPYGGFGPYPRPAVLTWTNSD